MTNSNSAYIYKRNLLDRAKRCTSYESGLAMFDELISIDPYMLENRAKWFVEIGRLEEALNDFDAFVKLSPGFGLVLRAKYFSRFGTKQQALADYDAHIEFRSKPEELASPIPKLGNAYRLRANYYEEIGEISLAETDFDKASRLSEGWLPSFAAFCLRNNLLEKYQTCLDRLVLTKPALYLGYRAEFYRSESRLTEALNDYDNWVGCSRVGGWKLGYSPRAWALKNRSEFFKQQNRTLEYIRDKIASELILLIHRAFGFSGWPRQISDGIRYSPKPSRSRNSNNAGPHSTSQ